ncbi:MAG: hypothetical protein ACE145_16600, partial [Terriglobia bacterium]
MSDEEVERQWVKQTFGAEPEEIKALVEERRAVVSARSFIADHAQDYVPTDHNGALITRFLLDNNLEPSRENMERAFENLQGQFEKAPTAPARPVAPRRPASSGI